MLFSGLHKGSVGFLWSQGFGVLGSGVHDFGLVAYCTTILVFLVICVTSEIEILPQVFAWCINRCAGLRIRGWFRAPCAALFLRFACLRGS